MTASLIIALNNLVKVYKDEPKTIIIDGDFTINGVQVSESEFPEINNVAYSINLARWSKWHSAVEAALENAASIYKENKDDKKC